MKGWFVGCEFECNVLAQRPTDLSLLASLPVPFTPEDISQPLQNRCAEDAAACRWGDSKNGDGKWEP